MSFVHRFSGRACVVFWIGVCCFLDGRVLFSGWACVVFWMGVCCFLDGCVLFSGWACVIFRPWSTKEDKLLKDTVDKCQQFHFNWHKGERIFSHLLTHHMPQALPEHICSGSHSSLNRHSPCHQDMSIPIQFPLHHITFLPAPLPLQYSLHIFCM